MVLRTPDYRFGGDCGCVGVEIFGICKSEILPRVLTPKSKKFICTVGSMENLEKLKKDKRLLKSSLTKYLNELAVELSPKNKRIVERLNDIEKRRDELLELLENLQALYKESKETRGECSVN